MLEIVFGDSACGSLKIAQSYGSGKYNSGCVGVIIAHADGSKPTKKEIKDAKRRFEEQERLNWENATPLGGSAADVYGFSLALSIGDISEGRPGVLRLRELEKLYGIYPLEEGTSAAHDDLLTCAQDAFDEVCRRVNSGESVRIWYSDQPDEMCGMYWIMSQLIQLENRENIYTIKLPEWESSRDNCIVKKRSWGDVSPGEWHKYIDLQKLAVPEFCKSCAMQWEMLRQENAKLRAVLNGQLISVPEDIYDSFIINEIESENTEFNEAVVVGRVLGKYQLGIGDSWVALRIEKLIDSGKLEIIAEAVENEPSYRRILRKTLI